ncbi:MAG: hypothetical protein ACLTSO_05185 [Coprococcus sp.]
MKKIVLLFIVIGILAGMVTACGSAADGDQKTHDTEISQQLTFDHSETLDYAQKFSIDRYQDDYVCDVTDDSRYLVVPAEKWHRSGSGYCCDSAAGTEYLSGGFGGYGYVCVSGCIGQYPIQQSESGWVVYR